MGGGCVRKPRLRVKANIGTPRSRRLKMARRWRREFTWALRQAFSPEKLAAALWWSEGPLRLMLGKQPVPA